MEAQEMLTAVVACWPMSKREYPGLSRQTGLQACVKKHDYILRHQAEGYVRMREAGFHPVAVGDELLKLCFNSLRLAEVWSTPLDMLERVLGEWPEAAAKSDYRHIATRREWKELIATFKEEFVETHLKSQTRPHGIDHGYELEGGDRQYLQTRPLQYLRTLFPLLRATGYTRNMFEAWLAKKEQETAPVMQRETAGFGEWEGELL